MEQFEAIAQHLLRSSPDGLIVVDDRGLIRFANETVAEMFRYEPAALIGMPIGSLIPERFRGKHQRHVDGYVGAPNNREMGARITDLFARRADGSEFPAGIRLAPFRIDGAQFVAAAIRDVTEQRIIKQELMTARQDADRANRAKSRFLATASHDLRQPMQAIRLLNSAMLKVVSDPGLQELLSHQAQAIDSMTRLVNSLLDISRLESGAIEPMLTDVPLAEVYAALQSEFSELARKREIGLDLEPTTAVLRTDRTLFYQLLQNLLGNAIKYTDRGSVSLRASTDREAMSLLIEDTGIGIPADKIERIFDEYYQVDTHGAKRVGVGLGLAIVKEVARLLGFSVQISSQLGVGTQVRIRIPRRCMVSVAPASEPVAATSAATGAARKSRLLLVEDNEGVRRATELFLKLEGYTTQSASSLADAQRLFAQLDRREVAGDMVIADYHLDGKNTGLDMLLKLRERLEYDIPAIILSGDLPSVLRAVRAPVPNCKFLSKPVDTDALLEAIAQLGQVS